jgi:hypothetical protein
LPSFLFFFVLSCILPFSCLLSVLLGGAEQQLMLTRDACFVIRSSGQINLSSLCLRL